MKNLQDFIGKNRQDYDSGKLTEKNVPAEPIKLFETWMHLAVEAKTPEPIAFNLATASLKGQPSSRVLLLRSYNKDGFVFYSNYRSRKGKEIEKNPYAAMNFFWSDIEKQIRIEGRLVKVDEATSDAYFASRPRESQIGAWASVQSSHLKNRGELDKKVKKIALKFEHNLVPRPAHWGGYRLIPSKIEFWQGRANRLHDRIIYERKKSGWKISRLSP